MLAPIRSWDRYGDLDRACIEVLNEIVAHGEADVVVSSTLRYSKTVAELQAILEAQGFTGRVLDRTPTGTPGADRGEEIAYNALARSRRVYFWIFPVAVVGSGPNSTVLGTANRGSFPRQNAVSSSSVAFASSLS